MNLKFGWACPTFAGAGDVHPDTPCLERIDFNQLKSTAGLCDKLGYDAVWVADHLMLGRDSANFECWTALTALGMVTSKVRLGVLGLTPEFRNPALSAKMIATLDVISGGRFDYLIRGIWTPDSFGVSQWGVPTSDEFDAYNVLWDNAEVKVARATEVVDLSSRLWTEDKVSYEGKFCRVKDAVCNPKPLQKPRPPIIVEGDEETYTLKLAAKVEGWCGAGLPALMKRKVGIVNEYCRELHTDPNRIQHAWIGYVLTAQSKSELQEKVNHIKSLNPKYPMDRREFQDENLFGTPDELVGKVKQFIDAGVNYFATFFLDYPSTNSMEIFAKDVLPKFRS